SRDTHGDDESNNIISCQSGKHPPKAKGIRSLFELQGLADLVLGYAESPPGGFLLPEDGFGKRPPESRVDVLHQYPGKQHLDGQREYDHPKTGFQGIAKTQLPAPPALLG